jgi:hypothetical protein
VGQRGLRALCAAVSALALCAAGASAATINGINVDSLAQSLNQDPVQVVGSPAQTLTGSQVSSLTNLIHRVDDGRIWVAVIKSMGQPPTHRISNLLAEQLNANGGGTVVVVAGPTVWGTTSWEDGAAATGRLSTAFKNDHDSLARQLRKTITSFASGDAAAGHPQISSSQGNSGTSGNSGNSGSSGSSGSSSSSSGGIAGVIIGIVVLLLIVGYFAMKMGPGVRRARKASHWRKEEHADLVQQVNADFARLGEEIEALDIDTSMPNASGNGKDEYSKAMDCYQEAERRLKQPDDEYQFHHAQQAVHNGLQHIHAAERLLNQPPSPAPTLEAPGS